MNSSCTNMIRKLSSTALKMNGAGGRSPAPWGRGRSGWAATGGCAGRWPGCGACPRLGFAARGRCGPSPGVLRGRADAGGARVEGATIDTAWRRGTASRSRSLFLARRRRRVRQQGASRGFWAKCSEQDVAPVTPIRHLRTANARVCTSRMPCALTAILLPESRAHGCHMLQTWFPGWTRLGCARGAGPNNAHLFEWTFL